MSISEPFIRRSVGTSLLAAGLFLLGIVAYRMLPVAPLPKVDIPTIGVSASLPGADPATVASSLAAPLEHHLGQIAGLNEMTSVSSLGGANVTLQFDLSRPVASCARDVAAAISAAQNDLPINLPNPPTYRKYNPGDSPIMILAMTSDTLPLVDVYEAGINIVGQKFSQIQGVSQAIIAGSAKTAIRVQINPAALASTGLSLENVRQMIGQVNIDSPKGSISGEHRFYSISANDQLTNAQTYQDLLLTQPTGAPIQLSALGSVIQATENDKQAGWFGTNLAVLVILFKQSDANVIDTVDRVKEALPLIQSWIPPSIKMSIVSDRTVTIRASVNDVQFSLLLSICLVVMVIFLFLRRFWPTFIACVTVPLALAGTFAAMYLFNYSLDNLSLMAITISVGFVVDDAIVVIENIFRFIEHGEKPMPAALKGARQVGFTVVSMSTSLIAVFIPLLFMGGLVGRMFHEFAVTLSLAILVSGVISLSLTPMLCSRFLKPESAYGQPGPFYRFCEGCFDFILEHYSRGLRWVLRHQPFMLLVTLLTLFGTIWLYTKVPSGFFPQQDTGIVFGSTEASQDISFDAMVKLQKQVAEIILADPAVATLGSFVGGGSGGGSAVNTGRVFITLKPHNERKVTADQVINRLRGKLAKVVGINLFLTAAQDVRVGGRFGKGQYQYAITSADLAELNYWSEALVAKLSEYPELKDVTSDQQTRGLQENVVVNRDAAARLGISPADIDNTLYDAFGQRQVSVVYDQYNQHHVVMEVDPRYQMDPDSLNKIYIKSTNGTVTVPLATVAKFVPGNAYLSVNHQGQFPASTITFNLAPGVSLGQATQLIQKATDELKMPSSVQGSFQGTAAVYRDSLSTMPLLAGAALVAVYIVLGILYESLVHPITILSTLPSAGVGALIALIVCNSELSLVSFIGIILLMGIVKKNAIMMVDFYTFPYTTLFV